MGYLNSQRFQMLATRKRSWISLCGFVLASCMSVIALPAKLSSESTDVAIVGKTLYRKGRTACRTIGNAEPRIYAGEQVPTVGEWITLSATVGTTPDPKGPEVFGLWVVGHSLLKSPMTTVYAPDCWLLVEPVAILPTYTKDETVPRSSDATMEAWRWRNTAYLALLLTPPMKGKSVFVQFIAHAPGQNMLGMLISSCIELKVGDSHANMQ